MTNARTRRRREPDFTDEVLVTIGDEYRRRVLYYLRKNDDIASVGELRRHLSERTDVDQETAAALLHHAIIPRLDAVGMIAYDPGTERILYRGGSLATGLIEWIHDREGSEY